MEDGPPEPVHGFPVPGVWAYADQLGVPAGGRVHFHVCAPAAYDFSVVRLGTRAILDPAADEVADRADVEVLSSARRPAAPQTISPGSYIYVEGPPVPARSFTLGLWVRPWRIPVGDTMQWQWSGLITDFNYPEACRFALLIDHMGRIGTYAGDGGLFRSEWLHLTSSVIPERLGQWTHAVATIGHEAVCMYLDGELVYKGTLAAPPEAAEPSKAQLRIAGSAERDAASNFLDGDIALPFIAQGVLDTATIRGLADDHGRSGLAGIDPATLLGYWPLDEERGTRVADGSGNGRNGCIVNHATWQIGGPDFDASLGRPGYDPTIDPRRGHGLRFASDDLVDCRWPVTDSFDVPEDAAPGIYAARICLVGQDPLSALTVPFAVVRARPRQASSIALLLATNTWHAYGRIPRDQITLPGLTSSFYTHHVNGRPFFHLGLKQPIPHATPYGYESVRASHTRHSHLVRPERFAQAWLESEGYPYECLTDLDLHREPAILHNYQALLIVGHNEYWSDAMREGVLRYLDAGGRVLCMSGNTLFWRVSFDETLSVMESRKTIDTEGGPEWLPPSQWGERWHCNDGKPGGTWLLLGQPTYEVLGLTMGGMVDDGTPAAFVAFHVEEPSHFLFHEPESVPLTLQGTIGEQGLNGPKASGYEMDATPQHVGLLSAPTPGLVTLASATGQYSIDWASIDPYRGADLIYWERPEGGQVVNAGSIAFSGALAVDPGVQAFVRNVLAHFGVPRAGSPSRI